MVFLVILLESLQTNDVPTGLTITHALESKDQPLH